MFKRLACFYVIITRSFERFQDLSFEINFLKNEAFFLKKLEYYFLVEATKIENATFRYKTDLLETNFVTNRMGSKKWTYFNECNFASN